MSKKSKGGKKKQPAKDVKEAVPEVDKEFFELEIQDLNKKLARLRSHCQEIEEENEETKKALHKLDEDRADIIAYLKRLLQAKSDEIVELQERLTALQLAKEIEKEVFTQKIASMENDFKVMHEQLTSEIKLLNGKLNSLEEFRSQREDLMNKYLIQEKAMAEQEERHKVEMYEVEKKFIRKKDKLTKELESKLIQLSLDCQNVTQMRIGAMTQRVIRENFAFKNEIASLKKDWNRLKEVHEDLIIKHKEISQNLLLEQNELQLCLSKNLTQTNIIEKISLEHDKLIEQCNKLIPFEKESKERTKELAALKAISQDQERLLQITKQLLHGSEIEKRSFKIQLEKANKRINILNEVLTAATKAVKDCAILDDKEDLAEITGERNTLLLILLELFNSIEMKQESIDVDTSIDTITMSGTIQTIYQRGDLGVIDKDELESKETLGMIEKGKTQSKGDVRIIERGKRQSLTEKGKRQSLIEKGKSPSQGDLRAIEKSKSPSQGDLRAIEKGKSTSLVDFAVTEKDRPQSQGDLRAAEKGKPPSLGDLRTVEKGKLPSLGDLRTVEKGKPPSQGDLRATEIEKGKPPSQGDLRTIEIGKTKSLSEGDLSASETEKIKSQLECLRKSK